MKRNCDKMNNEDIKWITINHVHIPIKPNQTKEEAFKEFTQKQDKRRELNDMTVDELKTITDPVERIERNGKIIALLDLKIDLQNGEFGELEIGD